MSAHLILLVTWTLLGAIIGSFINAFVHRWPRRISMVSRSRSFCPRCEAVIRWHDNIPVVSFLVLRGKCRSCGEAISPRYLIVEVLMAALFAAVFARGMAPESLESFDRWVWVLVTSAVVANLVALSFVDIETFMVPVVNTSGLIVFGLVLAAAWPHFIQSPTVWTGVPRLDAIVNSLQGILLGGGLIWAVGAAAELIVRKEAMGGGDVKILAGVGAVLGWKAALVAFFLAPFAGSAVGIPMLLAEKFRRRRPKKEKGITYNYEPDEKAPPSDDELARRRIPLKAGLVVTALQAGALLALPGARDSFFAAAPFYLGVMLGFFMVFYDVVRTRLVREKRWIDRDITRSEDGATQERLEGNYLPFGPFLAAAAVVMVFFGEEIIAFAAYRFFGAW